MWAKATIRGDRKGAALAHARAIVDEKTRYMSVQTATGVPWWWVGIVHTLEGNRNFATHLHNGDSLKARTVRKPYNRPATGTAPFTWQVSAEDALRLKGLHEEHDWSIPKALWNFERYNGFGYTRLGVNSPYVWSYTNLYTRGKYVSDGKYDATAVSQQCGAAAILRTLIDLGAVVPETKKEHPMSVFAEVLDLIKPLAPGVASALGGPLVGIAVKALADELKCDNDAGAVAATIQTKPASALIPALQAVEAVLSAIAVAQPAPKAPAAAPTPSVAPKTTTPDRIEVTQNPVTNGVIVDGTANIIKTLVSGVLFVLASLFIKDAAMAHSVADMVSPLIVTALTTLGGGLMVWLQNRSVTASNAATLTALASR